MDLPLTIRDARSALDAKKISARELVSGFVSRSEADELNAVIEVTRDQALEAADACDRGETSGPLAGIPIGLKDMFNARGTRTTAASRMLENFTSPYDGTAVAKLRSAGAAFTAKLNQDEFAMGGSGEKSAFGPTLNPLDRTRVPGGSSSGSAAAVAAGFALAALGTDTGGSIRQPAGFTGIAGLKPTYGRVSRYGVIPMASSFDTVAPCARDCRDLAVVLAAIAGPDPRDQTTAEEPVPDFISAAEAGAADPRAAFSGKTFGIPRQLDPRTAPGFDDATRVAFTDVVRKLGALGSSVREIDLPGVEGAVAAYYILVPSEVSTNMARYDGLRFGHAPEMSGGSVQDFYAAAREALGPEVRRRIMLGAFALSAGYYDAFFTKACRARTLIRREFLAALDQVDAILTPTSPVLPWRFGEKDDPLSAYAADSCTIPVSLAGLPGLSVPGAWVFSSEGGTRSAVFPPSDAPASPDAASPLQGAAPAGGTPASRGAVQLVPAPTGLARETGVLPVGIQLVGKPFSEAELLRLGAAWEASSV